MSRCFIAPTGSNSDRPGGHLGEPERAPPNPYNSCAVYIHINMQNRYGDIESTGVGSPYVLRLCEGKEFDTLHSCRIPWYTWISATHSLLQRVAARCRMASFARSMEVTHGRRTSTEANRGWAGRHRRILETGQRQAAGEWLRCSSTCQYMQCNPAGDSGCNSEDRISNWKPFRAHQKAACAVMPHPVSYLYGTKYNQRWLCCDSRRYSLHTV